MDILEIENLTVKYDNYTALEGVNLNVKKGEYLCIVGSNGAGKSTLLKAVLGLIKYEGKINWGTSRNKISYIPQSDLADKSFPATVTEVVLSGRLGGGFKFVFGNIDRKKAKEALEKMQISNLAAKRIGELSGGQRQRVLLARALCSEPEVLILDEPISNLDENMTSEFYEMLVALHKQGMTLIMVTHSLDEVITYADRVASLERNIVFLGNAEEYSRFRQGKNE